MSNQDTIFRTYEIETTDPRLYAVAQVMEEHGGDLLTACILFGGGVCSLISCDKHYITFPEDEPGKVKLDWYTYSLEAIVAVRYNIEGPREAVELLLGRVRRQRE